MVAWLLVNLIARPAQFLTVLGLDITFGSLYGLIALGYTLVYGILELIIWMSRLRWEPSTGSGQPSQEGRARRAFG